MPQTEQISSMLKLDNQLCFPLYAASRLIIQSYEQVLSKHSLTYPQYLVLLVLWENDAQSVKEIGAKLFLDSGTLTPLLKKLQTSKIIERKRSAQDDRHVLNLLTPKGKKLKVKIAAEVYDLFCRSKIKPEDASNIRKSVTGLTKTLIELRQSQLSDR